VRAPHPPQYSYPKLVCLGRYNIPYIEYIKIHSLITHVGSIACRPLPVEWMACPPLFACAGLLYATDATRGQGTRGQQNTDRGPRIKAPETYFRHLIFVGNLFVFSIMGHACVRVCQSVSKCVRHVSDVCQTFCFFSVSVNFLFFVCQ